MTIGSPCRSTSPFDAYVLLRLANRERRHLTEGVGFSSESVRCALGEFIGIAVQTRETLRCGAAI